MKRELLTQTINDFTELLFHVPPVQNTTQEDPQAEQTSTHRHQRCPNVLLAASSMMDGKANYFTLLIKVTWGKN